MKLPPVSIRVKIAAACALTTAAGVLVFATGTLVNIYEELIEAADMELASEARHVAQIIGVDGFSKDRIQNAKVASVEPWVAFAVFEEDGTIWRSSGSLPEEVARAPVPGKRAVTIHHEHGGWRVRSFIVANRTVVVSYDLEEVHDMVLELLMAYALALPLAGLVAGLGGWWVAGRALKPIRNLTSAADQIRADNLSARVPVPAARDDVAHLAEVLNAMLGRLERSFRQAERFASDASHELRTPLTIMRGVIEAMLRDEQYSPNAERRLVSLQEETDRLERITGNLLLLARFDAGESRAAHDPVDFSNLVGEACDDFVAMASAREVTLEATIAPQIVVQGDNDLLRRLILNLLDNATKFNVAGGRVRCSVTSSDREARLVVANTGPGIPAEMRPRVFERFFRADLARERAGHGLGLALSREIVRSHGGDLQLSSESVNGWTEFVASIPNSRQVRRSVEVS